MDFTVAKVLAHLCFKFILELPAIVAVELSYVHAAVLGMVRHVLWVSHARVVTFTLESVATEMQRGCIHKQVRIAVADAE